MTADQLYNSFTARLRELHLDEETRTDLNSLVYNILETAYGEGEAAVLNRVEGDL